MELEDLKKLMDMRRHLDGLAEESKHRDELLANGINAMKDRLDQLPTRSEMRQRFAELLAAIRLSTQD